MAGVVAAVRLDGGLSGAGSGFGADRGLRAGAAVLLAAGTAAPPWLAVHGVHRSASRVREHGRAAAACGGRLRWRRAGSTGSALPAGILRGHWLAGARTGLPDTDRTGRVLIDVRPEGRIKDEDEARFAAAREAALVAGWRYLVVTGWRPYVLTTLDTLSAQRRRRAGGHRSGPGGTRPADPAGGRMTAAVEAEVPRLVRMARAGRQCPRAYSPARKARMISCSMRLPSPSQAATLIDTSSSHRGSRRNSAR